MRLALVCAASALLSGCSLLDQNRTSLKVSAEISSTSFRAGDQVIVTITTTNNGFRSQGISTNTCPLPFTVLNAEGKRVGPPGQTCSLPANTKTLTPGESYVQSLPWTGYGFDKAGDLPMKLSPGKYSIRSAWNDDQVDNQYATFQIVN